MMIRIAAYTGSRLPTLDAVRLGCGEHEIHSMIRNAAVLADSVENLHGFSVHRRVDADQAATRQRAAARDLLQTRRPSEKRQGYRTWFEPHASPRPQTAIEPYLPRARRKFPKSSRGRSLRTKTCLLRLEVNGDHRGIPQQIDVADLESLHRQMRASA